MQNLPTKKPPSPSSSTGESYQTFREEITTPHKLSQKIEKEGILPNEFYEAKTLQENYSPKSLLNISANILNKILANQTEQIIVKKKKK